MQLLRAKSGRTCEAVGHPHILAVILAEQNTDHPPLCLAGDCSVVVVDGGEEDERSDGDVSSHQRERFRGGGRHRGKLRTGSFSSKVKVGG